LVNNARGLAKTEGTRLPAAITPTLGARALEVLKGDLQAALKPLLEQVDQLGLQIAAYDAMLGLIAGQPYQEETKVLCSVPGVGILTSLRYVLTLSGRAAIRP
jgi:transposase